MFCLRWMTEATRSRASADARAVSGRPLRLSSSSRVLCCSAPTSFT